MNNILNKYAQLLVDYSLYLEPGDHLLIKSTTKAEDLVREVYREALKRGANVSTDLSFRSQTKIFFDHAESAQLEFVSPIQKNAFETCNAYLYIRAPFNLREDSGIDAEKMKMRQEATKAINDIYFTRIADGSMKRSLCQFPTLANAQEAGMSFEDYQDFVFNACKLYEEDPISSWLELRKNQQKIVDLLNQKSMIRYVNEKSDIQFSVKGRTWINSDGRNNMPSGEVFSSPVEDSVQGRIHFDYPSIFMGEEVQGITLIVEKGMVVEWDANVGKSMLDKVFNIPGANYFGEVAIGTNYNIQKATKNILFDEKIGGTVHMAVGQSYKQTGGKNESSIHWDMIADMKQNGEIYADNELIYKNGAFLF